MGAVRADGKLAEISAHAGNVKEVDEIRFPRHQWDHAREISAKVSPNEAVSAKGRLRQQHSTVRRPVGLYLHGDSMIARAVRNWLEVGKDPG